MSTRDRFLDGAAQVMGARGLANTTTKEVARATGLSEAMLYKVFRDKTELFLAVLTERLPRIAALGDGPDQHVGRSSLRANLRRLAREVLSFYLESFPIAASVFSDPGLLSRHRDAVGERGAGPRRVVEGVSAYLAAEQQEGRMAITVRADVVAELLVGACLHRAFLVRFAGEDATTAQIQRFAADVIDALEPALTRP